MSAEDKTDQTAKRNFAENHTDKPTTRDGKPASETKTAMQHCQGDNAPDKRWAQMKMSPAKNTNGTCR